MDAVFLENHQILSRKSLADLYLEYVKYLHPETSGIQKPDDVMWMKDTIQQTLVMCMPQDRNIHNNIFGISVVMQLSKNQKLTFLKIPQAAT